jgi:hypothetical protein
MPGMFIHFLIFFFFLRFRFSIADFLGNLEFFFNVAVTELIIFYVFFSLYIFNCYHHTTNYVVLLVHR